MAGRKGRQRHVRARTLPSLTYCLLGSPTAHHLASTFQGLCGGATKIVTASKRRGTAAQPWAGLPEDSLTLASASADAPQLGAPCGSLPAGTRVLAQPDCSLLQVLLLLKCLGRLQVAKNRHARDCSAAGTRQSGNPGLPAAACLESTSHLLLQPTDPGNVTRATISIHSSFRTPLASPLTALIGDQSVQVLSHCAKEVVLEKDAIPLPLQLPVTQAMVGEP